MSIIARRRRRGWKREKSRDAEGGRGKRREIGKGLCVLILNVRRPSLKETDEKSGGKSDE